MQSTRMALESPKIDICQNGPQGGLGDVSSCLETKFDKKMSMGSVPNCRKEIAHRYGIRWFKCKLKPPKKTIYQIYVNIQFNLSSKTHIYIFPNVKSQHVFKEMFKEIHNQLLFPKMCTNIHFHKTPL